MTLEEWTEQWASYLPWAEDHIKATTREQDFFDQLCYFPSSDLKPGESAAIKLCWAAKTKAERDCLRDYFNQLSKIGYLIRKDLFSEPGK